MLREMRSSYDWNQRMVVTRVTYITYVTDKDILRSNEKRDYKWKVLS